MNPRQGLVPVTANQMAALTHLCCVTRIASTSEIAAALGVHSTKAHNVLRSLCTLGLAEKQDGLRGVRWSSTPDGGRCVGFGQVTGSAVAS
jgi:DNA-binding MarR family transcriptional regulator